MEKDSMHDYHHWGANMKIMDIIKKRVKRPETARLVEDRQEITKPGNFWFKFDSNLNQKVWVPRKRHKKRKDEVASIDLERLFTNNEKIRCGGECFEFNEPKASKRTERNKQELKNVSTTAETDVVRPTAIFLIVEMRDYEVAEMTKHYNQVNHVMDKPKAERSKQKKTSRRPNSTSCLVEKTLFHKTSVDPKLLQLKIRLRNKQKERAAKIFLQFSVNVPKASV